MNPGRLFSPVVDFTVPLIICGSYRTPSKSLNSCNVGALINSSADPSDDVAVKCRLQSTPSPMVIPDTSAAQTKVIRPGAGLPMVTASIPWYQPVISAGVNFVGSYCNVNWKDPRSGMPDT